MNVTDQIILIAEDDESVAKVYIKFLQRKGFKVIHVYNGAHALEILSQHNVVLMLLDLGMPGMNGYETLLKVREEPDLSLLPVIILSNTTVDEHHEWYNKFNNLGIVGIYRKYETSLEDLLQVITKSI